MKRVVIATDTFIRADSATLGSNWTTVTGYGNVSISSNHAGDGTGSTDCDEFWNGNTFNNDQFSKAIFTSIDGGASDFSGVIVRATVTNNHFVVFQFNKGSSLVQIYNPSTAVTIATFSHVPAANDELALEVIGTTYTGYLNGVPVCSGTNVTFTSGSPGIALSGVTANNSLATPWSGGNMVNSLFINRLRPRPFAPGIAR